MSQRIGGGAGSNAAAEAAARAAAEAAAKAAAEAAARAAAKAAAEAAAKAAAEAAAKAAAEAAATAAAEAAAKARMRSSFEEAGGTNRRAQPAQTAPGTAEGTAPQQASLAAQVAFHKLTTQPEQARALQQLQVATPEALQDFAHRFGERHDDTTATRLWEAVRPMATEQRNRLLGTLSSLNAAFTRVDAAHLQAALARTGSYDTSAVTATLSGQRYAPEGNGTPLTEAVADMALNGGQPPYGADGSLNCTQAAAYAQDQFANQQPPVHTEVVVSGTHAVLRMPDGTYYDPSRAMDGSGRDPMLTAEEAAPYQGVDGVTVVERDAMAASARKAAEGQPAGASAEAKRQAATQAAERTAQGLSQDGTRGEVSATTEANGDPAVEGTETQATTSTGDSAAQGTADAQQVQAAYDAELAATGGNEEAASVAAMKKMEDLTAAHPGDTAYADALIAGSQTQIDQASKVLADRVTNDHDDDDGQGPTHSLVTSMSNVAASASPAGADAISGSIARAIPPDADDLNQLDDAFGNHVLAGGNPVLGNALVASLRANGRGEAADELEPNMRESTEEFNEHMDMLFHHGTGGGDPARAAEWVANLDPSLQTAAIRMLEEKGMLDEAAAALYPPDGTESPYATEENRRAFATAMNAAANARPPVVTNAELQAMAAGPSGAAVTQLQTLMGNMPAIQEVDAATAEFQAAQERVNELNQEMAVLMGPGFELLTPAEQEAAIANFMEAHKEDYERWEQAGANLTNVLTKHQGALNDPAASPELKGAVEQAALKLPEAAQTQAGQAYVSQQVLAAGEGQPSIFDHVQSIASRIGDETAKKAFVEKLGTVALQAAAVLSMETGKADTVFNAIGKFGPALGISNAQELVSSLREVQQTGSPEAAAKLNQQLKDAGVSAPLAEAFKVLGIVVGAVGVAGGISNFNQQNLIDKINTLAQATQLGVDGAGMLLQWAGKAHLAQTIGKLNPALNIVGAVYDGIGAYKAFTTGETAEGIGKTMSAVGGLVLVGASMQAVPVVGTIIGGALIVGGMALSMWDKHQDQQELEEKRRAAYEAAGVDPALIPTLVSAESERVNELVDDLGMNAEQVRELIRAYPELLTEDNNEGLSLERLKQVKESLGLTGDQVFEMLRQVTQGTQNPQEAMHLFLWPMHHILAGGSPDQIRADLQAQASDTSAPEEQRAAYQRALEYLTSIGVL